MSAVAGITALIGAVKSLVNVGSNIINVTSQFEQTQKSLETVLQSAEKGQKLFEDLRKFSFDTTFGVDELASASSQLLNAGMAVDGLQDSLKTLGDLAQGDKVKFQELTSIFAKVQNTGKVTSMQLQQIALRGIPIQKTLKEMGVVGTASASDLTKAFQKLTEEGGQFHNAMDNIIDTIEGKRGFITDTLKEIYVNFGEVTGLTDAYKTALDFVYSILEKVNNKLMEWNENPVMKALMSGLLATILTGLVTIIGVSLVSALNTIIVKLGVIATLKTFIGGAGGLIALGVAGFAGLVAGIKGFSSAQEVAIKNQEELNKKMKEAEGFGGVHSVSETSRNERLKIAQDDLKLYRDTRKGIEDELKKLQAELNEYDSVDTTGWGENELAIRNNMLGANGGREAILENIKKKNNALEYTNKLINDTSNKVKTIQDQIKTIGEASSYEDVFKDAYESVNKTGKEIDKLEETLTKIQAYRGMNGVLGNDNQVIRVDTDQVDATIAHLKKQLEDLKIKLKLENAEDWQIALQKALGLDDITASSLIGKNGGDWIETYIKQRQDAYNQKSRTDSRLGINRNDIGSYAETMAKELLKVYENLMSDPTKFGINDEGMLDKTTSRIAEELDKLHDLYVKTEKDEEEWQKILNNAKDNMGEFSEETKQAIRSLKDMVKSNVEDAIQGSDVGNFLEKYKSNGGDALSALIEVIVQDLAEYIVNNEKVQYLLNIIRNTLQALSPFLDAILNVVASLALILKPILDGLNKVLNWIFGDFNKACDDLYHSMEDETIQRERNTQALVSQYQRLISVMKEQEEYYIHKKAELNAWSLKDYVSGVTPVNDMILTPNGTFSTHPNDTIIATKNPSGLGSGDVKVIVNNYSDANVDVKQNSVNGMNELLVTISKKVASDVAGGLNGWDSAFAMQKARVEGRRL